MKILMAVVIASFILAGCGGGEDSTDTGAGVAPAQGSAVSVVAQDNSTAVVDLSGSILDFLGITATENATVNVTQTEGLETEPVEFDPVAFGEGEGATPSERCIAQEGTVVEGPRCSDGNGGTLDVGFGEGGE